MKIAFYAPLKSPDHPVPSGDRQMARALVKSLELAGHSVELVSQLRCFSHTPHSGELFGKVQGEARAVIEYWGTNPPDLWFSYHPYYKSPDFLFLEIDKTQSIPLVTAECSLAEKRDKDEWAGSQGAVRDLLHKSRANFYFTDRDLPGMQTVVEAEKLVHLPPFIDATNFQTAKNSTKSGELVSLVTMGMMRGGVKFDSYEMLSQALEAIKDETWHLTVIGDGPKNPEIREMFDGFAASKIAWVGEAKPDEVPNLLANGDIFLWPGFGEAYGLAYLEAQAAGLPVVAQRTHGVPFVVKDQETGILVAPGDVKAYSNAVLKLTKDEELRKILGKQAAEFIRNKRNLEIASQIIDDTIRAIF